MPAASLDKATLLQRVGTAVAVIVEGEETGGDAWIYGDIWFGGRAREIRFLPQGSWGNVVDAVAKLRSEPPLHPVYGLIDRDCSAESQLDDLVPQGVYRSRFYSVENYLLDPDCWHRVFQLVMRPHGGLPPGWASPSDVEARITACYHGCRQATAFNRVVSRTAAAHPEYASAPRYIRNLRDARLFRREELLLEWARRCAHSGDLSADLRRETEAIEAAGMADLPCLIDGKMVQEAFLEQFQSIRPGKGFGYGDYVNLYLHQCPDPPLDAINLLERILRDAGRA
ncbi:MAG TPA: hypothetical protein VK689_03530 [Armatimonadota bacterium]|nr:hypothetical protein [Armatimonadota bacterium]